MHPTIIRVIKVNDTRSGTKEGRQWSMQDAECVLLDEKGDVTGVGVLTVPKALMGALVAGDYVPSFVLTTDMDRRVVVRISELKRVKVDGGRVTALPPLKAAS